MIEAAPAYARRVRPWPLAALVGAYTVIVLCALIAGGSFIGFAHNMAVGYGGGSVPPHADWLTQAMWSGLQIAGGVLLAGSIVGVPVAMLLAGSMAWLESRYPACRQVWAWLGGSVLAVLPPIAVGAAIAGPLVYTLPLLGCALVGAAVAWAFRHRPFA